MKALNNQKELEKTAKAMQNIIEGYGDQYLVPTFSILDDLADDFFDFGMLTIRNVSEMNPE
jgi:hypothetical protein